MKIFLYYLLNKYLVFSTNMLRAEIDLCRNTGNDFSILQQLMKHFEIEIIYWIIFWGYRSYFNENSGDNQGVQGTNANQKSFNQLSVSNTMNQSNVTSSISQLSQMNIGKEKTK